MLQQSFQISQCITELHSDSQQVLWEHDSRVLSQSPVCLWVGAHASFQSSASLAPNTMMLLRMAICLRQGHGNQWACIGRHKWTSKSFYEALMPWMSVSRKVRNIYRPANSQQPAASRDPWRPNQPPTGLLGVHFRATQPWWIS